MTKTTRNLLILVLLVLTVQEAYSSSLKTLSNALAPSSGEVRLYRDKNSYYVKVDLEKKPAPGPDDFRARIRLNSDQTQLYEQCMDCGKSQCNFTADADENNIRPGRAAVFLDYSAWVLKSDASFDTKKECDEDIIGYLGFGTGENGIKSYVGKKTFSIYINHNGPGSKLLFRYDSSLAASDEKMTFQTDGNWQTAFKSAAANIKVGDQTIYFAKGALYFDIHSENVVQFTSKRFNKILDAFREYGISCDGKQCRGKVEDFPKLNLNIGENSIEIPPEFYTEKAQDEISQKLGIKHLRISAHSLEGDDDIIVLGNLFMNYYYPVFESTQNKNTISVYPKKAGAADGSSSSSGFFGWPLIAVIVVVILGVIFCLCKRKSAADYQKTYEY